MIRDLNLNINKSSAVEKASFIKITVSKSRILNCMRQRLRKNKSVNCKFTIAVCPFKLDFLLFN